MISFFSCQFSGRSEAYIDQSRGISVNIGSADIRTSMLKQRSFLSKTYVFMQEEQQGYKVFVEQAILYIPSTLNSRGRNQKSFWGGRRRSKYLK